MKSLVFLLFFMVAALGAGVASSHTLNNKTGSAFFLVATSENPSVGTDAHASTTERETGADQNKEVQVWYTPYLANLSASDGLCLASSFVSLVLVLFLLRTVRQTRKEIAECRSESSALADKVKRLNEKILTSFVSYVQELSKKTETVLAHTVQNEADLENQHSLVKQLAGRIVFMEVTMSKMDASVRGYKQLAKSIALMKENLKSGGYEIVEMLGKPYHSGMKLVANFMDDENLEKGAQIITSIIQPQINYNGVMIQSAQITVSQNI